MGRITVFLAALLASAALVGSATAVAKTTSVTELAGGPLVLKHLGPFSGYRMVVGAARTAGHASVAFEFIRTQSGVAQATVYTFKLPLGALQINRKLDTATLDTGTGLGRFGRVRMTFMRRGRAGTLSGLLEFRTSLGLIRIRSLPARIAVKKVSASGAGTGLIGPPTSATVDCGQYPHAAALAVTPMTSAANARFTLGAFLAARQRTGPLAVLAALIRHQSPAVEVVALQGAVPRPALALNGTRTARFDASGLPFMQGSLGFSRTGALPGCTRRASLGDATGSLRLRLDFFGTVSLLGGTRKAGAILIGPA